MASFCTICGKPLAPAQRFCGGCGSPVAEAGPLPPAMAGPPQSAFAPAGEGLPAPPPPAQVYQGFNPATQPSFSPAAQGLPRPPAPAAQAVFTPPPAWGGNGGQTAAPPFHADPPPGAFAPPAPPAFAPTPSWGGNGGHAAPPPGAGFAPQPPQAFAPPPAPYAPVAAGNLPPAPQPWDLQVKLAATAESIVGGMNLARATGGGQVLAWMFRAALLDGRVARLAAADERGNGKALLALLIASGLPMALGFLFGPAFGAMGTVMVAVSLALAVLGTVAALGIMSALSASILGVKLTFGQIFRGLAYAQSPALLGFLPLIGMLVGLWRLPTSLVAIREISGAETGKAAILLILGGAAAALIGFMIVPIVMGVAMRSLF